MRVSNRVLLGLGILLFVLESQAQVTFLLRRPSAVVPASPGITNGLIAWYDFADATDAHAAFDLTESNSPSYTAGSPNYGSSTVLNTQFWRQATLDASFATASNANWAWVARVRLYASMASGDYLFYGNSSKATAFRHSTASDGANASIFSHDVRSAYVLPETTNWVSVACVYSNETCMAYAYTNGILAASTNQTAIVGAVDFVFGSNTGTTSAIDADYDYIGFWSRALSPADVLWLYNSGGTRTYSDLLE